jgi:hypothetical protein
MLLTQDFEQRAPVPITFICFEKAYSCNLQCVYSMSFFPLVKLETRRKKEKKLKFSGMDGWMGGGEGGRRILLLYGVKLP